MLLDAYKLKGVGSEVIYPLRDTEKKLMLHSHLTTHTNEYQPLLSAVFTAIPEPKKIFAVSGWWTIRKLKKGPMRAR